MNTPVYRSGLVIRVARALVTVGWLIALGCAIWAVAAIYHDFPAINVFAAWAFGVAVLGAIIFMRGMRWKLGATFFGWGLCSPGGSR